jgi:hypothetical protein
MAGWGSYQPRKKTQAELAAARRHELGEKFPSGISELVSLAAKCRKKPKVLPPAPHPDDIIAESPPTVEGPCQSWVANMKAWRAGTAPVRALDSSALIVAEEPKKKRAPRLSRAKKAES